MSKGKNIMKKFLALLLAAIMLISLVACNKTETTDDSNDGQIDPPALDYL